MFCNKFVEKNYVNGDKIIVWLTMNYELCRNTMMHCFIETRENKYKDIRGTIDSKKRIYEGFEDWDICNEITFDRLEDFKNWFNLFTKR